MFCRFWLIAFMSCCLTLSGVAQKVEYTKREKNEVREGPGNYYPLIVVLRKGVEIPVLEERHGWIKCYVSLFRDQPDGGTRPDWWISKNTLVEKPVGSTIRKLELEIRSTRASASAVMAAVRGFGLRYGKANAPIIDTLLAMERSFLPQEYAQFQQELQAQVPKTPAVISPVDEKIYLQDYELTAAEVGIGLGIAGRIASVGLASDKNILKYLNLIAATMAEVSGAYDVLFKVYVTTEKEPKAFSVPGGYILVSQGLLNLCEDEAEVAGILGHEIMHIVLRHGLKEQYERRWKIRMEEAFAELEEEVGEEPDSVVSELEEFAHEAYETAVKPRLQTYEEEADRGAVVLLIRAGYDPMAVSKMILKVRDAVRSSLPRNLEDNPFAHIDFEKRNTELLRYIQRNVKITSGLKNEERFGKWMR